MNKVNEAMHEDEPRCIAEKLQVDILKKKRAAEMANNPAVKDEIL